MITGNQPVLKTGDVKACVGSSPTPSAKIEKVGSMKKRNGINLEKRHKIEWKSYGKRLYRRKFKNINNDICKIVKFRFYGYLN